MICIYLFFFSVDEVMKKLRSIRTQNTRELRRLMGGMRSGAGTDQQLYSNWSLFPVLDSFLRPHVSIRATTTNLVSTS